MHTRLAQTHLICDCEAFAVTSQSAWAIGRGVLMDPLGAHSRWSAGQLDEAARWAVGVVRRALHGAMDCETPAPQNRPAVLADLEAVGALFRNAQEAMLRLQNTGLVVAPPGTLAMTCHEQCLLRATAAAQGEDSALADSHLFNLASHPRARAPLGNAVMALATALGASGFWLAPCVVPAAALRVAQLQGLDLGAIRVAWPRCAKSGDVPR